MNSVLIKEFVKWGGVVLGVLSALSPFLPGLHLGAGVQAEVAAIIGGFGAILAFLQAKNVVGKVAGRFGYVKKVG